ncbi:hypothetical protein SKAU_G00046000 [Synaphobranchus kaupii]|uniref:Uncharacterized protein n=1 Tax=Synaphobranchus kaupii TaxID=118154 RepID=A0A9Q1G274_SYNKA|nr:hypothetical protein SKAU_G00046000 [Synaphobranchus kaupii]
MAFLPRPLYQSLMDKICACGQQQYLTEEAQSEVNGPRWSHGNRPWGLKPGRPLPSDLLSPAHVNRKSSPASCEGAESRDSALSRRPKDGGRV